MPKTVIWLLASLTATMFLLCCSSGGGGGEDDDSGDDADDDDDDDSGGDTTPPDIEWVTQLPNTDDEAGPYPVEARITDNVGVKGVRLYYDVGSGYQDFWMAPFGEDGYRGQIPGQASGTVVRYFVKAWDEALNEAYSPPGAPDEAYVFHIRGINTIEYDDGIPESFRSAERPGDCLVVRFTPPSYPAQVIAFSSYVWDYDTPEDRVRPIVLIDPTGSGGPPMPWDAAWRGETEPAGYWRQWYTIELGDVVELQDPLESGDVYIGFEYVELAEEEPLSYGFDTSDPTYGRAWYFDQSRLTWFNLEKDLQIPGNLLFRATVHLR